MASPIINIKFLADLKQFSSQMQNANRSLEKTGAQLRKTGASLTAGLTLPLVGLGALGVKTFAEFEQEMAKVKAISGATADQFKLLEENAKNLGATTRFTASEVAALQLNYSKLGFNPSEILKVTDATLDLALATGEDLANSAVVAASTLRGFGISADETQRVVDVMAKSFSSSALDLEKFQTAMAVVAPVANTAGASIEDTTGYLSVLVNAGIDASTAGTGLRNIFLDVAKSGDTLEGALAKIVNSSNQNATAMDLFGKRGATVATVLAKNFTEANKFSEAYRNAGGAASDMAAIMDNTLQGAFFRIKSALEGAFISIGEQLAPAIRRLAELLTGVIDRFNNLSPSVKKFIVVLGGIAAAIGPLLALAGTILPAIGTGFALLTGPIGLIVAGLTAVGVIIYKNWAPIKKTLIDIANYFIDLYNESTLVRVGVQSIINVFKNLFEVGKFVFETLKNIISGFVDNIVNGFKTFGAVVKAALTGNFSDIPDILRENTKKSKDVFKGFTQELANDWENLTEGIKQNGQAAIDAITSRNKIEFIKEDVDASAVKEVVSDAVTTGIKNGLSGKGGTGGGSGISTEDDLEIAELDSELADLNEFLPSLNFDLAAAEANSQAYFGVISNQYENFLSSTEEQTDRFTENMERLRAVGEAVGASVGDAFANLTGRVVESLGLAKSGFQGFIAGLLQTVTKLISMMLAQSISQAIAGATASGTATGPAAIFTTPTFIATAVSGVLAAFAAIPKFNYGGIVSGTSYYGDKILARVNSGELILNTAQQKELYNQLNTPTGIMAGEPLVLDTRISGEDIILVQDRAKKSLNRQS